MIQEISLVKSFKKEIYDSEVLSINNLATLNIFIGKNNSGKSRLMRSIFSYDIEAKYKSKQFKKLNDLILDFNHELDSLFELYSIKSLNNKSLQQLKFSVVDYIREGDTAPLRKITKKVNDLIGIANNAGSHAETINPNSLTASMRIDITNRFKNRFDQINEISRETFDLAGFTHDKIYIPILRGLRPIGGNNDVYKERTIKDYFKGLTIDSQNTRHTIYTGLNMYNDLRSLLLGNTADRKKVRNFEKFLSENFFHDNEINLVPKHGSDVIYVLIGEEELPIYELGDGIQAIIILTYPLFFNSDKEMLVLIEEPEQCLHPGLQRIFIQKILNKFSQNQYFISTHSNHFLSLVSEYDQISLFGFSKSMKTGLPEIDLILNPGNSLLESIGVLNSSIFISNCTIWVEGISDRIYLRKFLDVYFKSKKKNWKEDYHFGFIEYSGNNIVHWNFGTDNESDINAKYISNRIFLIADMDYNTQMEIPKSKKDRFLKLRESLGHNFQLIDGKEIENTLKEEIVEHVLSSKKNVKLEDLKMSRGNKKINPKKSFGEWIENTYNISGYKNGRTLANKVGFAKKYVTYVKSVDDLSSSSIELCKKIENFIELNNR